uniref:BRCT domain-containing protein n=1 Tax=Timema douglasi TaxID=61478 RepID=A0A7R8ZF80_TIMDO|nr:unnamed protein product [Timema douglasi]
MKPFWFLSTRAVKSTYVCSSGSLSEDPKKYQVCGHVLCSTCAKPGITICPKCGAPSRSSEITTDNFSKNFLLASRKVSQLLGFTSEQLQADKDEDEAGTHSCGKQGTKKPSVRGGKSKAKKLEQLATGSRQRGTSTRTQSEDMTDAEDEGRQKSTSTRTQSEDMSGAEDGGRQKSTSTRTKSEDITDAEDEGRQKSTSTRTQSEDMSGAEDGGRQKSTSTRTKSEDITDAEDGGRQNNISTRTKSEDMIDAEDGGRQKSTSTRTKSEDMIDAEDGGRQKNTSTRTKSEDTSGAEDEGRQKSTSTRTKSEDMIDAEDGGIQKSTSTKTKSEDMTDAEDGGRQKSTSTRTKSEDMIDAEDGGIQKSTSTRTKSKDITDTEGGGRQTPASNKKGGMTPAKKDLKRNAKGETPLHVACIKGNAEQVKALLETGVTPNTKDNAGWTPLHEAASHGYTQIVRLLLESGALPSVPGVHNATPLHDAVSNKLLDIVRLLVKFGADPLARDSSGNTPRDYTEDETMLVALEGAPVQALPSDRLAAPRVLNPSRVVVLASELDPKHLLELQQLSQCVRIRILRAYTNEVTHVVTNVSDNNTCSPSLAILHGILQGKWIVNTGWITACNKAGRLVDPLEFEVLGTIQFPNSKTPQRARINAQKLLPSLFNNCHMFLTETSFVSAQLILNKAELAALVKAGGGKILSREPDPEFIPAEENVVPYHAPLGGSLGLCAHYIIYPCGPHVPQLKYNMRHIKTLSFDWLLKCIETFSLVEPFY